MTTNSKPIFLHFLSRGLLEAVNAYNEVNFDQILDDFRFVLLASYEPTYISTAHLFENKFAYGLINKYPNLFWFGHIQVSQNETSIGNLVDEKKAQYEHIKHKYNTYWDDTWKIIVDKGPNIKYTKGVSLFLEKSLLNAFEEEEIIKRFNKKELDIKIISSLTPHLIGGIRERGKKAITNELFSPIYGKFKIPKEFEKNFNLMINEYYLQVQINREAGTIMTGLNNGGEYYSFLSPTYPTHHLPIWKEIYQIMGCRTIIRTFSDLEFYQIRESEIFIQFVDMIRLLILEEYKHDSNNFRNLLLSKVKFINFSKPSKLKNIRSIDDFLASIDYLNQFLLGYFIESKMTNPFIEISNSISNQLASAPILKTNNLIVNNLEMTYLEKIHQEYVSTQTSLVDWQRQYRLSSDNPDKREFASGKIEELKILLAQYEGQIIDEIKKVLPDKDKVEFAESVEIVENKNLPAKVIEGARDKIKNILNENSEGILTIIGKGLVRVALSQLGLSPTDWGL